MKHPFFFSALLLAALSFSACRTLKRDSTSARNEVARTETVKLQKQTATDSSSASEYEAQTARDGSTSWRIRLSNDSAAPLISYTAPDGTRFLSRASELSFSGNFSERQTVAGAHEQRTRHSEKTDSAAHKSERILLVTRTIHTTRTPRFETYFLIAVVLAVTGNLLPDIVFWLKKKWQNRVLSRF